MQWHEIFIWASSKLEQARERNDGDLDATQTAVLRGRISILKELIALPEGRKILEAQSKFVNPVEESRDY